MKIEQLKKGLIVSCQAMREEPMYGSDIMAHFALAAKMGGAVGLRVNTVPDILAVQKMVPTLPIIGILKRDYDDTQCRITSTLKEVEEVYRTHVEIIAMDCTNRPRHNGEKLEHFLETVKREFPDILIMADIRNVEEGVFAFEHGADIVGTTLAHIPGQFDNKFAAPNLELVAELHERVKVPVIAEGRYFDGESVVNAMKYGAHNVVIGAGITRPQVLTERIVRAIAVSGVAE